MDFSVPSHSIRDAHQDALKIYIFLWDLQSQKSLLLLGLRLGDDSERNHN